jgi:uncharacterized delta-60 repeat protein
VRYLGNGSLDTVFGSGGIVITSIGSGNDFIWSVAIQTDGKIVAVGDSNNGMFDDFALVRYNTNGSLDTNFGSGGIVTTNIGDSGMAYCVAIQSDGKIIAAGLKTHSPPLIAEDFALARYNINGSLDTNFGSNGIVATAMGGASAVASVAIQQDGKMVAAGYSNNCFALARYWP